MNFVNNKQIKFYLYSSKLIIIFRNKIFRKISFIFCSIILLLSLRILHWITINSRKKRTRFINFYGRLLKPIKKKEKSCRKMNSWFRSISCYNRSTSSYSLFVGTRWLQYFWIIPWIICRWKLTNCMEWPSPIFDNINPLRTVISRSGRRIFW